MANEAFPNGAADRSARGADRPDVSVIVPHYDDLRNLERCIALLAAQTLLRSRFEVVVADNNSRCGIDDVRRVCGDFARVVPAPVQGAGPARNAAIAASRGKALAFTDSDCRPAPDWLERGLMALAGGAMVGGRVDVDCEEPGRPTAVEAFERAYAFDVRRYVERVGFAVTANMFVARAVFDDVGEFRAAVAEDVDWGRRAVAAGYRWRFAPDAVVSHPARRDWPELTRKWRRLTREAYESAIETPNGRIKWLVRSFAVLASPLAQWPVAARTDKLDAVDQRLKAIGVLVAIRAWRFVECNRLLLADVLGGGATVKGAGAKHG